MITLYDKSRMDREVVVASDGKYFIGYDENGEPIANDFAGDIFTPHDGYTFQADTNQNYRLAGDLWVKIG